MMGAGAREGGAIGFVGAAFRAGDEGGAELRCDRAERKSGANALPIHDAARRDHRQSALGDEQAGEGEGAELVVRRLGIEGASMAPCLDRKSTRLNSSH